MGSLQMDDDDDDDDEISNYVDLHMYMLGGGWKWQDLQGLLWWIIIEINMKSLTINEMSKKLHDMNPKSTFGELGIQFFFLE
ncbi:hypothetical protein Tco_0754086 [Tanacetum coccineum]